MQKSVQAVHVNDDLWFDTRCPSELKTSWNGFPMEVGWVYFIVAPAVGRIKIGYTDNPSKRLSGLISGCPVDLAPLGLLRGTRNEECLIHNYLSSCHWKREWFDVSPLLLDFIRENSLPWSIEDVVAGLLRMSTGEYASFVDVTTNEIRGWFEARGVEYVWNTKGKNQR